jgi:O-antigen/teichoic acid export membrane protein
MVLSLRKNFAWSLAGSLVTAICQWGIIVILAKFLSPAKVGCYSLALAITGPVVIFSMLQLRAVQVTDAKHLYTFRDYFGTRLATNVIAILVVIGVLVALSGRYSFEVYAVILLVVLNKTIESTSDIAYGLSQKHERLDRVAQSMILRNVGAVILLYLSIRMSGSLALGVASIGCFWLFVLLIFDKRNVEKKERFVPRVSISTMKSIGLLGLPLGVVMGIISLNANMTRYFVEAYLGSESLGYFAPMAYVIVGASQVTNALGQSLSARLARYYVSNRKAYALLLGKASSVAIVLAICIVLFAVYFGKTFLSIIYTPEYSKHHDVFMWLMVSTGVMVSGSMFGYGLTAARRFKSQVPIAVITCVTSFFGSWLFVPRYGMKGAAFAMIIAAAVQCLASLIVLLIAIRSPLEFSRQGDSDE